MRIVTAGFLLLLAACEDRPAAPSAEQNAQLDEAEAMLDEEAGHPDICKTHPPYEDAKYEQWRQKALEAGCDELDKDTEKGPAAEAADPSD